MREGYGEGDLPKVVVVIPHWNRLDLLRRCLAAVDNQTRRNFHTVVVDNGSTDGSVQWVQSERQDAVLLRNECNLGFAAAANQGAHAITADFIALLNNDAEPAPDWLQVCVDYLETHPEIAFVASRVVQAHARHLLDSAGDFMGRDAKPRSRGKGRPAANYSKEDWILSASGCAAVYRRSAWSQAKGFDEDFFAYLEDVDLGLRLMRIGYKGRYLPDAVVTHIGGASSATEGKTAPTRDSAMQVQLITRNRILLWAKHIPGSVMLRTLPWWVRGWLASAVYHTFVSRQPLAFVRGILEALRMLPETWRKRRELQESAQVDDKNILHWMLESEKHLR